MSSSTHRYVPQGPASLASDAPGWSAKVSDAPTTHQTRTLTAGAQQNNEEVNVGPICWKCKGARTLKIRAQNGKKQTTYQTSSTNSNQRLCPVCNGNGNLPIRSRYINAESKNNVGGAITARRRRPTKWVEHGHIPACVQASSLLSDGDDYDPSSLPYALSFLIQANGSDSDYSKRQDIAITTTPTLSRDEIPKWLPVNPGEQLCNLVGKWRIMQKIGSHRWTTDDIVTAYIAATSLSQAKHVTDVKYMEYLDLGTGNGSVLQMVSWFLLSKRFGLKAFGVEARIEAVGLAKRSLEFNLGQYECNGTVYSGCIVDPLGGPKSEPGYHDVQVIQGDFRDLISLSTLDNAQSKSKPNNDGRDLKEVASRKYDLITGTPPYFRVDFSSSNGTAQNDNVITAAVINQGGMPTSIQSAPARCEFRGGIEAYCETASALLSSNGVFVVCENWLNNDRVWNGAKNNWLEIDCVYPVKGKVGKDTLFAVYVMKKSCETKCNVEAQSSNEAEKLKPAIVVRDANGRWTNSYAQIMEAMSIPLTSS